MRNELIENPVETVFIDPITPFVGGDTDTYRANEVRSFMQPLALLARSRTRDAAVRTAEDVIMETSLVRMGATDFAAFTDALAAPAVAVPEMVELMRRSAPWDQPASPSRD